MRSPEDMRARALAYARAGLQVLPLHTPLALPGSPACACSRLDCGHVCTCLDRACGAPGKHPRTRHGKDDATDDLEQVLEWWTRWPDANVGVRPPEGTAIVDVDLKSNGPTALHKLTCAHGGLVPTWTARTGGGGLHIWFRATGALKAQLCQGVDLKSHTGYVVMPPSLHASGRRYRWANTPPIAEAPAWLLAMARKPAVRLRPLRPPLAGVAAHRADDALVNVVTRAQTPSGPRGGNRNEALHWAACRAAERGSPALLVDKLRRAAAGVGLPAEEIERTLESAATTGHAA
jgi:Bifunctional DNA primase/polymerase, N-terminal